MISEAEAAIRGACAFMEISGRGNFDAQISHLDAALEDIKAIRGLPLSELLDLPED